MLQVLNQVVKLKNKSKIFATFTYSLKQAFSRQGYVTIGLRQCCDFPLSRLNISYIAILFDKDTLICLNHESITH